jgi:hypothetical protein
VTVWYGSASSTTAVQAIAAASADTGSTAAVKSAVVVITDAKSIVIV